MTDTEFNRLLDGPLQHPLIALRISRLAMALRSVVEQCGEHGSSALRAYCAARQAREDTEVDEPTILAP